VTEKNFSGMVTVGGMLATHHECGMFSSLDKTVASCQLVDTDYTVRYLLSQLKVERCVSKLA